MRTCNNIAIHSLSCNDSEGEDSPLSRGSPGYDPDMRAVVYENAAREDHNAREPLEEPMGTHNTCVPIHIRTLPATRIARMERLRT